MPSTVQQFFYNGLKIKYSIKNGYFVARFQINKTRLSASSYSFEVMKNKIIHRLHLYLLENPEEVFIDLSKRCDNFIGKPDTSLAETLYSNFNSSSHPSIKRRNVKVEKQFKTIANNWLKVKKTTTKESTCKSYEQLLNTHLIPEFGEYQVEDITRQQIQDFLLTFVENGKNRTAELLKLILTCIFDIVASDYNITNPVKKIVLPYYETKKGSALTFEEERILVDYCIKNRDSQVCQAILVLLYFGLRTSELKTIEIKNDNILECISSKTRKGRKDVIRSIPFTPMFNNVKEYVNFDYVKKVNPESIRTAFKRLFPNHHTHELRYTFITRCKECGVNPEVVMLWDGHSFDKDVKTSAVDRGYTTYSLNYLIEQSKLVKYDF